MAKINEVAIVLVILLAGTVGSSYGADISMHALGRKSGLPATGQFTCYNVTTHAVIACPAPGSTNAQDGSYVTSATSPSFTNNGNGTITDNRTGLMWKRCTEGLSGDNCAAGAVNTIAWDVALAQCENLSYAGRTDWRMPNIKELISIVNYQNYNPAIDIVYFPNTPYSNYHMASTTYSNGTSINWEVSFADGSVNHNAYKSQVNYVRCVRGGP